MHQFLGLCLTILCLEWESEAVTCYVGVWTGVLRRHIAPLCWACVLDAGAAGATLCWFLGLLPVLP